MKRVAILTTHRANNFGAVLQAYSLVMACRELGADAEILDWRCPHYEWQYRKAWRMHRNPIPALKYLWWYWMRERRARQLFDSFRTKLPMSRPVLGRSDLLKIEHEYDSFIVGSDQVWNPGNSANDPLKFDRTYLLDFVREKPRNAYAASIGSKSIEPASLVQEFRDAWRMYSHITMREHAGAEFVSDVLGRQVETVLDPVLLHDATFWRGIAANSVVRSEGKYVVIYNVHKWRKASQWLVETAHTYAAEHRCQVLDLLVPSVREKRRQESLCAGPAEFLALIDGAEAVFTNSFHASAFSVVFGKMLYLGRVGISSYPNSRFASLMRFANLLEEKRMEKDGDSIVRVDCSRTDRRLLDVEMKRCLKELSGMLEGK